MTTIRDEVVTELLLDGVSKYIRDWDRVNNAYEDTEKGIEALQRRINKLMREFDEALNLVVKYTKKLSLAEKEHEQYNEELQEARTKLKKLNDAYKGGYLPLSKYNSETEKVEHTIEELNTTVRKSSSRISDLGGELRSATTKSDKLGKETSSTEKSVRRLSDTSDKAKGKVSRLGDSFKSSKGNAKGFSTFIRDTLSRSLSFYLVNAIEDVIRGMIRLGGSILQGFKGAADSAVEFETAIISLSNVAQDKSLEELSDAAQQLGKDTELVAVSAGSATEGLTELYRAGLDDVTIFGADGLQGVLRGASRETGAFKAASDLAATSNLNFTQTTGLATTTLAIYASHLTNSVDKAAFLTDSFDYMVKTANSSRAEISDFSEALRGVGPTAYELKIPLNTVVDTLAILADNGVKGATAGTQLRQMLSNMTRETTKVTGALDALNIDLWDSEGNFKSLETIVGDFNTAFYETGTATAFVSNATEEQSKLFDTAIDQYDDATEKLYNYEQGLTDLSSETVDDLTAAQERAMVVMDEYATIGGEYVEVQRQLTDREVNTALLDIFGSRGRNTAAALLTDTSDAMDIQALSADELRLANKLLTDDVHTLGNAYDELHIKQQDAIDLETQVQKIIDSTAGKKEILDSILESYKLGFGGIFIEILGSLYEALTPLVEDLLPSALEKFDEWGDKLSEIGEDLMPSLVDWLGNKLIPSLIAFGDWLINDGIDSAIAFGSWVKTHIFDNLVTLYNWLTTDGKTMWDDFYTRFIDEGAIGTFVGWVKDNDDSIISVLTALKDFILNDVLGALEEYYRILEEDVVERTRDWGEALGGEEGVATGLVKLIEGMGSFVSETPLFVEYLLSITGLVVDLQVWLVSVLLDGLEPIETWITGDGGTSLSDLYKTYLPKIIEQIDLFTKALRVDGMLTALFELDERLVALIEKFPNLDRALYVTKGVFDIFHTEVLVKIQGAVEGLIYKIGELVAALLGLSDAKLPDIGKSGTKYSNSIPAPSPSGGSTTTNNYYSTQSNTVNASTTASPQELTSVFGTMSSRSGM